MRRVEQPTDPLMPWLYSLLGAAMVLSPLRVITAAWVVQRYPQLARMEALDRPPARLMGPLVGVGCVGCMELAVWLAWYVLFLVWACRTATLLRAMRAAADFSPAMVVVGLLPVVNLVMSPVVMSDLVLAAEGRSTRGLRVSRMAMTWWGCFIASVLMSLLATVVTHPQMLGASRWTWPLTLLQVLLGTGYLAMTMRLVLGVRRAVDARLGAGQGTIAGRAPEPWEI